jgi:hypothetical protein
MLDHVNCPYFAKRTVPQGVRKPIQIGYDVGARVYAPVEPYGAGMFVNTAADVKNGQ